MQKLGSLVGKRISKVHLAKRKDGAGAQVIFTFLDGSRCYLTSPDSEIEIGGWDIDYPSVPLTAIEYEEFETIEHAVFDEDRAYRERVTLLYHKLWDKAGTSDYVKGEWRELGEVLSEAGSL